MIRFLFTFFMAIYALPALYAQYTVQFRVDTVYSNVADMDGIGAGNSDPRWQFELEDNCGITSGNFDWELQETNCPGLRERKAIFFTATYQCALPASFGGRWRGMENDAIGSDANTDWINVNIPTSSLSVRTGAWTHYNTYEATAAGDRCNTVGANGRVTWRIRVSYRISGSVNSTFCNIGNECTAPIAFNVPKFNCGSTQTSLSPNKNINARRNRCDYPTPTGSSNSMAGITCPRDNNPPRDIWIQLTLPDSTGGATITFDNNGGCGSFCQTNITYAWYTSSNGTCSGLEYRGCDAVSCFLSCSDGTIYVDGRPGEKLWVRIWEEDDDPFELTITKITPRAPADRCYTAMPLEGYGCNYQATDFNEPDLPSWTAAAHPGGVCQDGDHNPATNTVWSSNENMVWFTYTHDNTGPFSIAVDDMACTGGAASAQLGLFRNLGTPENPTCDLATTQGMGCAVGVNAVELLINNLPAGNYILVVDGNAGAECAWTFKDRINGTLLPVRWITFDAIMGENNRSVDLSWTTERELNNEGFHIQRSLDGIHFSTINFEPANGTGAYLYKDFAYPLAPMLYYRLMQQDLDGATMFSKTVAVTTNINTNGISTLHEPYPNPTFNDLTLPFITAKDDIVSVYIYDALGRMVQHVLDNQTYNQGQHFIQIQLDTHLPAGIYTLRFESGQGTQIKRFVKQ